MLWWVCVYHNSIVFYCCFVLLFDLESFVNYLWRNCLCCGINCKGASFNKTMEVKGSNPPPLPPQKKPSFWQISTCLHVLFSQCLTGLVFPSLNANESAGGIIYYFGIWLLVHVILQYSRFLVRSVKLVLGTFCQWFCISVRIPIRPSLRKPILEAIWAVCLLNGGSRIFLRMGTNGNFPTMFVIYFLF